MEQGLSCASPATWRSSKKLDPTTKLSGEELVEIIREKVLQVPQGSTFQPFLDKGRARIVRIGEGFAKIYVASWFGEQLLHDGVQHGEHPVFGCR